MSTNSNDKGKELERKVLYAAVLHPLSFSTKAQPSRIVPVFVKIEVTQRTYENIKDQPHDCFSITGVMRPTSNGNADTAGQISDSIADVLHNEASLHMFKVHQGWTRERIRELLGIWEEYHLNDMRPNCEHQKQLWDLDALCHYDVFKFTNESYQRWNKIRNESFRRLAAGEQVQWTPDEVLFMSLDSEVHVPSEPSLAEVREKTLQWQTGILNTYYKYVEHISKAAVWTKEANHPYGLLSKACPTCGYKYGSNWLYKPIPASVMKTIMEFPLTTVKPAWI